MLQSETNDKSQLYSNQSTSKTFCFLQFLLLYFKWEMKKPGLNAINFFFLSFFPSFCSNSPHKNSWKFLSNEIINTWLFCNVPKTNGQQPTEIISITWISFVEISQSFHEKEYFFFWNWIHKFFSFEINMLNNWFYSIFPSMYVTRFGFFFVLLKQKTDLMDWKTKKKQVFLAYF